MNFITYVNTATDDLNQKLCESKKKRSYFFIIIMLYSINYGTLEKDTTRYRTVKHLLYEVMTFVLQHIVSVLVRMQ